MTPTGADAGLRGRGPRHRRWSRAETNGRDGAHAARIFISYRRADSGGWARSLHDKLEEDLGTGRTFRDVAMEGGMDFHAHVESLLDRCDVLLAIIGRSWTTIAVDGRPRLHDPEDLVRREIARALERPDVHVIPVLVDGARMPAESELPVDLAPLSRRQACELSDSRWDYDADNLIARLRDIVGEKPPRRWPAAWFGAAAFAAALIAALVIVLVSLGPQETPSTRAAALTKPTLDRGVTFGQYLDRKDLGRGPYPPAELRRRGALVQFDFRIQGYRHKRLPLRGRLIDAATGDQLAQSRDVAIIPDADKDQGTWDVWVPLPGADDRRFYVQVQLYDDRGAVPIGRLRTPTFAGRGRGAAP